MDNQITFTITCTMKNRWIPCFVSLLKDMQADGSRGTSRLRAFYSDGDGDFRPKFDIDIDIEEIEKVEPFHRDYSYEVEHDGRDGKTMITCRGGMEIYDAG